MITASARTRKPFGLALFLSVIGASLALSLVPATVAHADDEPELPFTISGNVKYLSDPLADVTITVAGPGYEGETVTDADGRWRLGVPTREDVWTVELDASTLPSAVAAEDLEGVELSREAQIGASGSVAVNFNIGRGERATASFGDQLVSRIVNGLNFGLMLALAAIGLSLVFGTTGLSNFAHAEMVTFGALAALLFATGLNLPILLAIPLAVIFSGLFGYGMDAALWRPLRHRGIGIVQLMIVSIGLSLALRYVYQFFVGGGTINLPGGSNEVLPLFGSIKLTVTDVVSMGVSIVVILAFVWWLMRTRVGKATRAISDNPSLASASGIDVDRVVRIVWIMAAALAGLAGVLWAYFRPGIKWDMGSGILLLMFAAVTLGGLGTAFGALVGSIIVGLLVEVSSLWIPADLKYVSALVVLIVILLFRPQGIFGKRERIG